MTPFPARSYAIAMTIALGAALTSGAAFAAEQPFTFNAVEYMPRDSRTPAAEAFIARAASPGAPVQAALADIQKAGAFCHASQGDGAITCTRQSLERQPGEHLDEIEWRVNITPDAQGRVVAASVVREKSGF
jgi:hypothetical protein